MGMLQDTTIRNALFKGVFKFSENNKMSFWVKSATPMEV